MTNKIDITLFITAMVLVFFGLIMVYSTSAIFSEKMFENDPFHIFKNQLTWTILGLVALIIMIFIPTRFLNRLSYLLLGITVIALILVFIPQFGVKVLGAKRWLKLGMFSFQPSELAKLSVILVLAKILKDEESIDQLKKGFFPSLGIIGIIAVLILLEPDFGTAVEVFTIGMIILFISGIKIWHLFQVFMMTLPFAGFLILFAGYRKERILAFLNPAELSSTSGYQIIQSLIAIGAGGVTGLGLGNSMQKLFYLPQAHSDYIFAIIGEELGLIGTILVLALFFVLLIRGFVIGKNSTNRFNQLVSFGITFHIMLQVFMNILITLGWLPPKGLPLPFFSAGGSSLIITLLEIGILLRISLENEMERYYVNR